MKRKLINILGLLFIIAASSGCTGEKNATTSVSSIENHNRPVDNGLIYSLPKTELFFNIRLVKTTVVPGPYNDYGEKLLGLSQVPHNLNTYWEIENLDIEQFSSIDYDNIYVVEPEGKFSVKDSKLTKKGWLLPLTKDFTEISKGNYYKETDHLDDVLYKDLSVKKFVGTETKTIYKNVWKDSIYAKVPVEESYTLKKNLEEKAKEAANFIFMIREKRFELISGMGDYYPEGEALKAAIEEMNAIEERYLTLFTGKKFRDTIEYTLHWVPSTKNLREPDILFRFSANEGVIDPEMQKGSPVWIEFNKISDTRSLENYFSQNDIVSDKSKFYYRIPASSLIRIKFGDTTIAKKYLDIFQYGEVIRIPAKYLDGQNIIEYYKDE